mmetsp:Transcript_31062/g.71586  ORF Transcript_31062/g.71586 Transcript_31062/m.71586 type:complete len:215 (+) Transcript_31062:533-1177(+)
MCIGLSDPHVTVMMFLSLSIVCFRARTYDLVVFHRLEKRERLRQVVQKAGEEYLAAFAKEEGVIVTENGVCIKLLTENPVGGRPTRTSTVQVNYHGTLIDGTVFDSTLMSEDDEPQMFPLVQVIPGWRDGIMAMREGEKALIGIPASQAYGDTGTPDGRIPPGSAIMFRVELLKIMSGKVGGARRLLGSDGQEISSDDPKGILGADGKPMGGGK